MVRNVSALLVCALALTLSSCGHQVTPNRTNAVGLQAGQMEIKWKLANAPDFVNNWYVLAFDVSCTGNYTTCQPYAQYGTQFQDWKNWDYEILVFQPNASSTVQAAMFEFATQPGVSGAQKEPIQIPFIPNVQLQIQPSCAQNTFCIIVDRSLFNGVTQNVSATPPPLSHTWFVNWIVASPVSVNSQPAGAAINAPGQQGTQDTLWYPDNQPNGYDITTSFDLTWTAQPSPPWANPPDPAAQYSGGEVINNP